VKKDSDKISGIDTAQAGKIIYVADDIPLQTIIYSVEDVLGNKVYFTDEAERYIKDSRSRKRGQQYVINYLQKIPGVLKDPGIIITDPDDSSDKTILYYKEIYIEEKKKQLLFTLVVKILKERIVYNLYPQESGKVKISEGRPLPKIIYLKTGLKKSTYFKR
jgi:hypothetical protein